MVIGGVLNMDSKINIDFFSGPWEGDGGSFGSNSPPVISGDVEPPPPIPCLNVLEEVMSWKYNFAKVEDLQNHKLSYTL